MVRLFLSLFICIMFFFLINPVFAEGPEIKVKVAGTIQAMASIAQTNSDTAQAGFGLRRVRLRFTSDFSSKIKGYVQFEATGPSLVDARIHYLFSKEVEVWVGRSYGAGMRGGVLTSHTAIDIVERPTSALIWARKTVGSDFRDYGAEVIGKKSDFTGRVWLHNGSGSLNLKPSERTTASIRTQSLAVDAMGIFKPKAVKGLETGGHFGVGNKYINDYTNYSAYLYYEPSPFRVKTEMVSVISKDAWNDNGQLKDLTFLGYYVFGGYKLVKNVELLARYEVVDYNTEIDDDEETDITIGASYAFWPDEWRAAKITGAYVIQQEAGDFDIDNNLFYVMFQIVF
jgi:hypothetical protein